VMQALGYFSGELFHERTRQADSAVPIATVLGAKLKDAVRADMQGGIRNATTNVDGSRLQEIREAIAAHPRFFLDKGGEKDGGIAGLPKGVAHRLMDHIGDVLDAQMASAKSGTRSTIDLMRALDSIKLSDVAGLGAILFILRS
jgi:hypothetical protein